MNAAVCGAAPPHVVPEQWMDGRDEVGHVAHAGRRDRGIGHLDLPAAGDHRVPVEGAQRGVLAEIGEVVADRGEFQGTPRGESTCFEAGAYPSLDHPETVEGRGAHLDRRPGPRGDDVDRTAAFGRDRRDDGPRRESLPRQRDGGLRDHEGVE
ncbi:hypothetical protein OG414_37610 [Streptomyces sp. NBC_01174]|nr:hypothetical protein OG414_01615 [Streptomyces sp. NBC_01174]WSS80557.1 hypothetical protein OG414_37610 [Streptomyces sp. NBC_01174]